MKSVSVFLLFKLGIKFFRSGLMTLALAAILSFAGASVWAAERVEVGSYAELEAALINPDNAGQTIYLTADIATGGATIAVDAIADGVKIDGQGQFAIKGNGNGSFFLKGGQLQNLTIENFKPASDIAEGEDIGDINNVTFKDNKGKDVKEGYSRTYGGAIYNKGMIGDIINSSFINNIASNGSGGGYSGAIYNEGTIGAIKDSSFEGNTAGYNGGAIYNNGGTIGDIINTSFTNNSIRHGNGGAIDNNGTIGDIINTSFINNNAQYGGAIYNSSGSTIGDIIDSSFSNNTVEYYGGAIDNEGTMGDIINTSFTNNNAQWGGAIYNNGGTMGDIINTSFINNTSQSFGGAIFNGFKNTIGDIINTSFINNNAQYGGAINNFYSKIVAIKDSTFNGNTAKDWAWRFLIAREVR